jgi:hypothetical protein
MCSNPSACQPQKNQRLGASCTTTLTTHVEAMTNWSRRSFTIATLAGAMTIVSSAYAKHQHHNAQQLLGEKLNTNGKHDIHKVGDHTVSVQVQNKKISGVTVAHRTKGNVAVRKYKTSKKMAQRPLDDGTLFQPVSYHLAQVTTVYIGYSFSDGIDEYIYWFPADVIVDPFTGAVEYVPAA